MLTFEDVEPPSKATIKLAIAFAERIAFAETRPSTPAAPTRVMPNGEAGIVFEWSCGTSTLTWEIDARHSLEITRFTGGKLTLRSSIDLEWTLLA